jgi:hypothetical protein
MDTSNQSLPDLFNQLGLPNDPPAIENFIKAHRPLPPGVRLSEAAFWTPSQSQFLRESLAADAEWAGIVDTLAARLIA